MLIYHQLCTQAQNFSLDVHIELANLNLTIDKFNTRSDLIKDSTHFRQVLGVACRSGKTTKPTRTVLIAAVCRLPS